MRSILEPGHGQLRSARMRARFHLRPTSCVYDAELSQVMTQIELGVELSSFLCSTDRVLDQHLRLVRNDMRLAGHQFRRHLLV